MKLKDKVGRLTNKSAIDPMITLEITFEDGTKELRHERAPEEMIVVHKDFHVTVEQVTALRTSDKEHITHLETENQALQSRCDRAMERRDDMIKRLTTEKEKDKEIITRQRHRQDQCTEEVERLESKKEELLNECSAITEKATKDVERLESKLKIKMTYIKGLDEENQQLAEKVVEQKNKITELSMPDVTFLNDIQARAEAKYKGHGPGTTVMGIDPQGDEKVLERDFEKVAEDIVEHYETQPKDDEIVGVALIKGDDEMHLDEVGIKKVLKDGEASINAIAELCGASKKATLRLCTKMEEKGIIELYTKPEGDIVIARLEKEQEVSEPETESHGDARRDASGTEPPEKCIDEVVDKGDRPRSWPEEE